MELRRTGANILGAPGATGHPGSRPPSSHSAASNWPPFDTEPPPHPSSRTMPIGLMNHTSSMPTLIEHPDAALMPNQVATLSNVRLKRPGKAPENVPKAVWSDGCAHMGDDSWPAASVPLLVFTGNRKPEVSYREEVKFSLREDKYINFGLQLRCGRGDHYAGGTVGIVYSPDKSEAVPGMEGQLAMIIDLTVMQDNTIVVTAVGDLPFTVLQAWKPRGLRGLQIAFVDVEKVAPQLDVIPETCRIEKGLCTFYELLTACPRILEMLASPGPFTVFAPTDEAFAALNVSMDELLSHGPRLEALLLSHICKGKIALEAMYSGRTIRAMDGSMLTVTFVRWPRGGPAVNDVPAEHMDILCRNGVVHSLVRVLVPDPTSATRRK